MDWAGEKPARMSATKLIRSSGMLQFQKTDLHAPLTKAAAGGAKPGVIATVHAKMFAKKYFEMFQIVQMVMGQVDGNDDLARRIHQMLLDLIKHPQMRDEAYLYILKQCNVRQTSASSLIVSRATILRLPTGYTATPHAP